MSWGENLAFSSRAAYRVLSSNGVLCQTSIDIWSSRLPRKLKIFACLLTRDRLRTRQNLFAKRCAPSSTCDSFTGEESTAHIFALCRRAASTWDRLGMGPFLTIRGILDSTLPDVSMMAAWRDNLYVLLWQIWKARNNATFNATGSNAGDILSKAADDLLLWSSRFDAPSRDRLLTIRLFFLSVL